MVSVCPQCHGPCDSMGKCPLCDSGRGTLSDSSPSARVEGWQQTPGGRILIGVLVAVGLCYGLLQLSISTLRGLTGNSGSAVLSPLYGIWMFVGIQAVSLVAGALVTGVGQRRGIMFGALVGLLSGLLVLSGIFWGVVGNFAASFGTQLFTPGAPIRNIVMYALPIVHVLCGALGGLIGSAFWRPLPEAGEFSPGGLVPGRQVPSRIVRKAADRPRTFSWKGPIRWGRVLIGTAVAVVGAVYAGAAIDWIIRASEGSINIVTVLEDQVSFAEFFSLAIMLGGCIAGVSTRNGLKQGACVGLASAIVLAVLFRAGYFGSGSQLYPIISTLFLGPVGGWFASELLPPVVAPRYRRRRSYI
jgi:hypothetical protein